MIHTIELLDSDEVADVREHVARLELVDGEITARGGAKAVKRNLQSKPGDANAEAIHRRLEKKLLDHELVARQIIPRAIVGSRINRYDVDGRYGLHVDRAVMGNHRTDLSFTVFLSDPADYDGGELHLADGATSPRIKLPAGHAVIYPTRLLHEVTTVTRGERWGFVGWIESWIPDPEIREAVGKIKSLMSTLGDHPLGAIARLQLSEIEQTLLRIGSR